jgi:hypothetical protein
MSRTKQAAYEEIHKALDTGKHRKITLISTPNYFEDKKIGDFLRRLTDPSIRRNHAKTLVYSNNDLPNDFFGGYRF